MADDQGTDDNTLKRELCCIPSTVPKKTKKHKKPKSTSSESKENEPPKPPRRNPMRRARLRGSDGAGTSGCPNYSEPDLDDDLPVIPIPKKEFKKPPPPTIEEMVRLNKEVEEETRLLAEIQAGLDDLKAKHAAFLRIPKPPSLFWQPPDWSTMKNCKHLTLDQIEESFEKHRDPLTKIFNGEVYHERHDAYHKGFGAGVDLNAPLGLWLFEYKQLEVMVNRMIEVFDPESNPNMWKYFFQVLAPELCLLIFMDTYSMTRDESVKYLIPMPPKMEQS